jgi:hypothetical protein
MLNLKMNKTSWVTLLVMLSLSPVQAEVFKCKLASGKIVYQSAPCPSETKNHDVIEIKKMTPRQIEAAENKLKAWQAQQAVEEAARVKAQKELQEEIDRQETINAINRNAIAQQQQAIAAQRQAEALERQHFRYNSIYAQPPPRH